MIFKMLDTIFDFRKNKFFMIFQSFKIAPLPPWGADLDLDLHQNRISLSFSHTLPAHQISSGSINNFLRYPAHRQTNRQAVIDWYLRNRQLDLWPCLIKAVSREGSNANQKFLRWFCTKPSKIECLTSLWPWPLTDFEQNLISVSHHPPESRGVIWHW